MLGAEGRQREDHPASADFQARLQVQALDLLVVALVLCRRNE
jgi:hypothetical protein